MQLLIHTIDLICQPKSKADVMFFAKAIILLKYRVIMIVIYQIQEHLHMIHLLNAHSSSVDLTCWKMIMVSARVGPV